jgi:hypothetical protein
MTPISSLAFVAGALLCNAGCRAKPGQSALVRDSAALAARAERLSERRALPVDSGARHAEPLARWVMPLVLSEISGLALTSDGRLLAHGDEVGRVFEIDYRRGVILKRFTLGNPTVHDDFEAIAVAGQRLFLLASNGRLYEFREGKDGERVPYTVLDTRLGHECEFESAAFDPAANALVLVCKHVAIKSLKDFVVLYRWNLDDRAAARITQIKVPLSEVIGANPWKAFYPSDVAVDPHTGNYVIIASHQQGLLSLTPEGVVLFSRPLPEGHAMAEGVAITQDSLLIISDEATRTPAAVTLYRWP